MRADIHRKEDRIDTLAGIVERISQLNDLDTSLDAVLLHARQETGADAGTIYLVEDDKLRFGYVQNDTLFKGAEDRAMIYSNALMDMTEKSIAGYVALSGKSLNIPDAYRIPMDVPYRFNKSFDERSNYRTHSMLTFPLRTNSKIIGVIQLLNAKEGNECVEFLPSDEKYLTIFGTYAAVTIEKARLTRNTVLRMLSTAELNDPKETGSHVNRVGAYSVEIYRAYAQAMSVPSAEMKRYSDILRIAAMTHDIGKVGIPDAVLKKPGKLEPEEFEVIKQHTLLGARLFEKHPSPWDEMSREITLNHHEKFNGKGYPGKIDNIYDNSGRYAVGKVGAEIPLSARIVALADVYDALVSTRCYKPNMPEEKVLGILKEEKGQHFDPLVVDAFFRCYDVINAARKRYSD